MFLGLISADMANQQVGLQNHFQPGKANNLPNL